MSSSPEDNEVISCYIGITKSRYTGHISLTIMPKQEQQRNHQDGFGNNGDDPYKIHISRVPTKFNEEIVQRILNEALLQEGGDNNKNVVTKVELIYPREDADDDDNGENNHREDGEEAKAESTEKNRDNSNAIKEHRGFGFVSLASQEALHAAIQLQTVKGGRKATSKKLYTLHLRPYQNKMDEPSDDQCGRDVCYLWSLHRCPYGEDCKFQHVGPGGCRPTNVKGDLMVDKGRERKRKGKCFAFKKGKCAKGDDCTFSHDFETHYATTSTEESSKDVTKDNPSNDQKDCINWKTKGKCRKGDNCPYRHDPELQKTALEKKENKKRKREDRDEKSSKAAKKEKQPLAVRVFGLVYACTEDDVRDFFKDCGIINKVLFPTFEDSGRSKGYCGIWFASPKAVAKALELDGAEFQGRWLRIQSGKSMELREWETLHKKPLIQKE